MSRIVPLISPAESDDIDQLFTANEMAERFKVPVSWIYKATARKRDRLPHFKIGKYTRFRSADVRQWLERNFYR